MDKTNFSKPVSLNAMKISDGFWTNEMELIRKEVIPYQWAALNDRVEGAAPSFCMRNFKIAALKHLDQKKAGTGHAKAENARHGIEVLPRDPEHLADTFYGFVFQDSDFSKWIEAVGYSLIRHPDPELEKIADGAIDIVCAAQRADGYLDTYYIINSDEQIFSNLKDHHELYCFGHLIEGAVAYYKATGKDKLLKAAERFADYVADHFGTAEGKCKGYPGHEIAEMALVRLYETTGNQKYLELSRYFIEERGQRPYYFDKEHPENVKKGHEQELRYDYYQAHLPVRQQTEAVGHSVRAMYLYSGMADIARLTEDTSLYDACKKLWDSTVLEKMYITGGVGATSMGEAFSFPYDLPNDTAYAETCASIGLVFFARRMLEIEADARYANVMERAIYNGILSGMALDGKSFFYVNPLEVLPEACHKDQRKFHVKPVRQKWFGCACCPPNLARLLSSLGSYAFTENDSTLYVHLYLGCDLEKEITDKKVKVHIETGFPWNGDVRIKVQAQGTRFVLALRIPDWCDSYELEGAETATLEAKNGYLYVTKDWTEEDTFSIHFPMDVRLITASDKVREDIGKAAVTRGPIVYCLEETDNGKNLHELLIDSDLQPEVISGKICETEVPVILTNGFRRKAASSAGEETATLYRTYEAPVKNRVRLRFIPYYTWANRGENEMQVWTRIAD